MKKIISSLLAITVLAHCTALAFSDIPAGNWCEQAVSSLAADGVINGYEDGTFRPDRPITRAQFICLLARMTKSDPPQEKNAQFADVSEIDWFFEGVQWGAESGILAGQNGMFYPDRSITRQEAASMLARFLTESEIHVVSAAGFSDAAEISPWAADAVAVCDAAGLMSGRADTRFAPLENCTRGEAAAAVFRLQQAIEKSGKNRTEKIVISHYAYGNIVREFKIDFTRLQCFEFRSPDMVTQRKPDAENGGYQTLHPVTENLLAKLSDAGFFEWSGTYQRAQENGQSADGPFVTIDVFCSDRMFRRITCDGAFPEHWEDIKAVFQNACTTDVLFYTP